MRALLSFLLFSLALALPARDLGSEDPTVPNDDQDHELSNFILYASHYEGNVSTLLFQPSITKFNIIQEVPCGKNPS